MKNLQLYLLPLLLLFFQNTNAQPGCTDPQANNYDPQATENDGSCTYPTTSYMPHQIAVLPDSLTECSGLAFFQDRLWAQMDGGNPDRLYILDTLTGGGTRTNKLMNGNNTDWEDLAEDATHLYIGDFGNNSGDRTDLHIYKVKKTELPDNGPTAEVIEFTLSDQTDFTPAHNDNNYDMEAFFFWNDSLHLFSKNWVDFKTRHYVLPATPGLHVAQLRDSLEVQMQVTGADITEDGRAVLLGYNTSTGEVFLWLLFDFPGSDVFAGNKRKLSLGSALLLSQPEGIAMHNATKGFICSEKFNVLPPKLFDFDIGEFISGPDLSEEAPRPLQLELYPNPATDRLDIHAGNSGTGKIRLQVLDWTGKILQERVQESNGAAFDFKLNIAGLAAGSYLVILKNKKNTWRAVFLKQ
ncbi:MAG TPA: T9SS type A sorting domain-containing protein [Bacteroidetes bacterium]|nr:T9SS type A sorting domain-containing protein [Bacteroidota bacterium]